jgi:hypothetical protein
MSGALRTRSTTRGLCKRKRAGNVPAPGNLGDASTGQFPKNWAILSFRELSATAVTANARASTNRNSHVFRDISIPVLAAPKASPHDPPKRSILCDGHSRLDD